MARLGGGEERAVLDLHQRFGSYVDRMVRAVLRQRGWRLMEDDVDGLVFDACLAIGETARSWSPDGGALPWVWARRRIENCVDRLLGQYTVPLDESVATTARGAATWSSGIGDSTGARGGAHDRPVSDSFAALLRIDARCRQLDDAFAQVAISQFDKELLLHYVAEQHSGNRSPATTVGATFSLEPTNIRQRVRRTRQRLRHLAASNGQFAWLAELPLVRRAAEDSQTRRTNGQRPPRGTNGSRPIARPRIADDGDLPAAAQTSSSL